MTEELQSIMLYRSLSNEFAELIIAMLADEDRPVLKVEGTLAKQGAVPRRLFVSAPLRSTPST
ncbi:MAG: hypothetical protein C0469_00295 [Cyanobacteria bacterium DS2.3.42]|nr:hypothetical protein [Cyanobacteria bacterium DS2.3.42]